MIAITYRKINEEGVKYLPIRKSYIEEAKFRANYLYKAGYLNVRVVEIEEKILYEPGER